MRLALLLTGFAIVMPGCGIYPTAREVDTSSLPALTMPTGPIPTPFATYTPAPAPTAAPVATKPAAPSTSAREKTAPLGKDAWREARMVLPPSVPVYRPSFVADRFGPANLEEARTGDEYGPRYTIVYHAEDELLAFILGIGKGALGNAPWPDSTEPITVFGVEGRLSKAESTPTSNRLSQIVSWQTERLSYQIKIFSNRMTRDELLRIVASLEPVR